MAIKNYSYDYRQLSKVIYRTLLLGGNLPFHLTTMKLNLTKPLVIFDLETTGLDISKDRIIQISYIKVMPDGTEKRGNHLVNPERSLPQLVVELTSITDEMLADKPTFKQIAATLAHEFEGCDFAGFNSNRFDVPMLAEEFLTSPAVVSSTHRPFSIRWNAEILLPHISFIAAERWKMTSKHTLLTRIQKRHTECFRANLTCMLLANRKRKSVN